MAPKSLWLSLWLTGMLAFADHFNPLEHLGGNGPWFAGPNVFGITADAPDGCVVDQAAFVSRHGSRYPDPSAYYQWTNLSAKIQAAHFTTRAPELKFLSSWKPVLKYPDQQLSELSITGYKELYEMGVNYRFEYPDFYKDNTNYALWANNYTPAPRVVDSARLFARGYLGPNSSFANIYVINSTDPRALENSLAPSDLCPAYNDNGGGDTKTTWDNIWLPPVTARINKLLGGNLNFTTSDVGIFPYLCGFETQITGSRSPWCSTFTNEEILQYEYSQDLRYWYGTGIGTTLERKMMLPFLTELVDRFIDGPNATHTNSDGTTWVPPPLTASFTNDGQINQLAAVIGVFDFEKPLPGTHFPTERIFRTSNFVTMRGTIGFERLNCRSGLYMRLKLNDVVYPVSSCKDGPGQSCALTAYQKLVKQKSQATGNFVKNCNITSNSTGTGKTTFLTDIKLPFEWAVKP